MPELTSRRRSPSDLTDVPWALVEAATPPATRGRTGRPRKYPLREVWNAVFYLTRNGCSWRALPHDFPPWDVVWEHFRRWRDSGTLRHAGAHERRAPGRRARRRRPGGEPESRHHRLAVGADDGKGGPRASTPARR